MRELACKAKFLPKPLILCRLGGSFWKTASIRPEGPRNTRKDAKEQGFLPVTDLLVAGESAFSPHFAHFAGSNGVFGVSGQKIPFPILRQPFSGIKTNFPFRFDGLHAKKPPKNSVLVDLRQTAKPTFFGGFFLRNPSKRIRSVAFCPQNRQTVSKCWFCCRQTASSGFNRRLRTNEG
jgi:hypothetical protein